MAYVRFTVIDIADIARDHLMLNADEVLHDIVIGRQAVIRSAEMQSCI